MMTAKPFAALLNSVRAGDFVYFDPPYDPVSKAAGFTSYTASAFGVDEREFHLEVVRANRAIHSTGDARGQVTEVLVLSYANG